MKTENNIVKIRSLFGRVWDYLDYLDSVKKDSEGVINIDFLNEFVKQTITAVRQTPTRGIY